MIKKKVLAPALCGLSSFLVIGPTASAGDCGSGKADIVDTAAAAGDFNTLVAAVKAAELVDVLKSPGPFTVFAPTDEAFAKLPKGTLDKLLKDPDRLGAILKYHVLPGKVAATEITDLSSAKTALGQTLAIDTTHGVKINNANVIKTDIYTSNGVIHVIDAVLMPHNDIIEVARSAGSFKTLLSALEVAKLTDALRGEGPFTVFAPTDTAFAELPEGALDDLLENPSKLKAVLTYHVVPGKFMAKEVVKLSDAQTLQGQRVHIDTTSGVQINDARVVKTDIKAKNGIIHVIDTVLLPE